MTTCQTERVEPLFGCGIAGALKACVGIHDALPIVHGPVGCAAGHRIVPLLADKEPLVATTGLTEIDVIMGSEARLREAIERGIQTYHPALVVVILTCATNLTGEIQAALGESIENQFGIPCFVIDGSGVAGDDPAAYRAFADAFCLWEDRRLSADAPFAGFELAGLSAADFEAKNYSAALREILRDGLGVEVSRTLFENLDMKTAGKARYSRIHAGLLWMDADQPAPAPVGAKGIRQWLAAQARVTGKTINPEYEQRLGELEMKIENVRQSGIGERLRVGIECTSWLGLGMARFFGQELGCSVLLSTDANSCRSDELSEGIDEIYVDMGNLELVDRLIDFGANLVFGSSYTRRNDWEWVPVYQPVWHLIDEQGSWLGIEGTERLLSLVMRTVEATYGS